MTVPVAPLGGRIQALAGAGTNDTRKSLELAADDEKAGATRLLLGTPYYSKLSTDSRA